MKFSQIDAGKAQGMVLGHSVKTASGTLKKGTVLSAALVEQLKADGIEKVFAAELSSDDVPENQAAREIAHALAGDLVTSGPAATGRCNLYAGNDGVVELDAARITAINLVHESITIATLVPFERVKKGQMLATVKIIPYAVGKNHLAEALGILGNGAALHLRKFEDLRVSLIISRLAETKNSLVEKSERAMRSRIEEMGGQLKLVRTVEHETGQVAAATRELSGSSDLVLVFGASAIVDRADVIPAAIVRAGGVIEHLGMPVDPGNLLLLGRIGKVRIVGVPSCARSRKQNGFDRVLERLMAGLDVTSRDLMNMGVGGLLKEIPSRPSPRES